MTKKRAHLSLLQCVEELMLISVDSAPDCISVRVNVGEGYVQVVDNGKGIEESHMHKLGERSVIVLFSTFI